MTQKTIHKMSGGKIKAKLRVVPLQTGLVWSQTDSCYHCALSRVPSPALVPVRLAMFDLDDTLLNGDQIMPNTIKFAQRSMSDGMIVVVMSNQYGVTKGQTTNEEVQARFRQLAEHLPSAIFMYSTDKDRYRKPMTGMFDLLLRITGWNVDLGGSFYCGDAVGRAGDFAVTDLYFAHNCGVKCFAPPEDQLSRPLRPIRTDMVHKKHQNYSSLEPLDGWLRDGTFTPTGKTLVMTVGPQGCGKSTLAKFLSSGSSAGLRVLNRDTIGSTAKLEKEFIQLLSKGITIILDNTNYDKDKRRWYISRARQEGYDVVIYYFNIPKELSFHMCHMRVQLGGPRIPPVAIHTYYKNLQPPEAGIDDAEIVTIDGILSYDGLGLPKEYKFHYDLKER